MSITLDELRSIFIDSGIDKDVVDNIDPEKPLSQQGVDSIDFTAVIITVQDRLGIEVGSTSSCDIKTLDDLKNYLIRRQG